MSVTTVDEGAISVETLCWVEPCHIILSISEMEQDAEAADAHPMHLTWSGSAVPSGDAKLMTFIPVAIEVWGTSKGRGRQGAAAK